MKIRNFVIAGVVTAASIVALMPAVRTNAAECSVGAVGGDHTQKNITVNGTTASVKFAVKGDDDCKQDVTFAAWEAPSKTGLPLNEQKLYNFTTGSYGVGIHEVSVQLPVCETDKNIVRFYQADLLRGTNPTNVNGSADYAATGESARLIDWKIGGENSGHIICLDRHTTPHGIVSALQVLACIKRAGKPASEVCRKFEPVPQLLKNVRFSGGAPLESKLVKSAIEDARARLGKSGRLVIRASGTEPLIRVMGEADDADLLGAVVDDIVDALGRVAA